MTKAILLVIMFINGSQVQLETLNAKTCSVLQDQISSSDMSSYITNVKCIESTQDWNQ